MTENELTLVLSHLDNANHKLDRLDEALRKHMAQEEKTTVRIEKRLSKLEWKAHGFATAFGMLGAVLIAKIRTLLGLDNL